MSGRALTLVPWVLATIAIHAVYFFALGRAYRHGDFSRVTLVVAGSPSLVARQPGAPPEARGRGTAWALLTGVTIATYSLVDKGGVARLDPVPYIALMRLGIEALLAPVVLADRPALAREWRANWRTILIASTMNLTSYLLVAFLGTFCLGEGRFGPRLAGASIVLAGVMFNSRLREPEGLGGEARDVAADRERCGRRGRGRVEHVDRVRLRDDAEVVH